MAGILPDTANGGLVIRSADGTATPVAGVVNSFSPPAAFHSTCLITALPSDCTARISAAQVNAISSELLALMAYLNPTGSYNCGAVTNLASNFAAWAAGINKADGTTIGGAGTTASQFHVLPQGVVSAICSDDVAGDALSACLISADAGNYLRLGTDGRLKSILDLNGLLASLCSDPAGDQLATCMVSNNANNALALGTDGRLFASLTNIAAAAPCQTPTSLIGLTVGGSVNAFPYASLKKLTVFASGSVTGTCNVSAAPGIAYSGNFNVTVANPSTCFTLSGTVDAFLQADISAIGVGDVSFDIVKTIGGVVQPTQSIRYFQSRTATDVTILSMKFGDPFIVNVPPGGSVVINIAVSCRITGSYNGGGTTTVTGKLLGQFNSVL